MNSLTVMRGWGVNKNKSIHNNYYYRMLVTLYLIYYTGLEKAIDIVIVVLMVELIKSVK